VDVGVGVGVNDFDEEGFKHFPHSEHAWYANADRELLKSSVQ
jgi:hypothetical protein